jgi:hypothetical protein
MQQTHTFTVKQVLYEMIPQEIIDELMELGQEIKRSSFRIGRIANALCAVIDVSPELGIGRMEVYEVMAEMLNHEISARTIRYYASVESFYPDEKREMYSDLPFSHFAYAMGFQNQWEKILDHSMEVFHEFGKPPSRDALSHWLAGDRMSVNGGSATPPPPPGVDESFDPGYLTHSQELFTSEQDSPYGRSQAPIPQNFSTLVSQVIQVLRRGDLNLDGPTLQELEILRELICKLLLI